MADLIWVHEGALRLDHPVFSEAINPSCAFVFDDSQLREQRYTLKRLQFITETLLKMNVPIYRGDTQQCLARLLDETGASRLLLATSPNPTVATCVTALRSTFEVVVVEDDPFLPELDGEFVRFFKFWNEIKKQLLS